MTTTKPAGANEPISDGGGEMTAITTTTTTTTAVAVKADKYDFNLPWYTMDVTEAFRLTLHRLHPRHHHHHPPGAVGDDSMLSGTAAGSVISPAFSVSPQGDGMSPAVSPTTNLNATTGGADAMPYRAARHDGLAGHKEVERNRETLGGNYIPVKGGPNVLKMLVAQFVNSITLILGAVAIISAVFGDWAEFGVVLFVIIFNGLLGFYQEFSAEKSLHSLKEMTTGSAKVVRHGKIQVIPIDDVVVGDVVILEQGASVPADLRLFESSSLEIDEALLTGEGMPVNKHIHPISDPTFSCALGDRKNLAFRNTLVTQGRGRGIVIAAGLHTEVGKLAARLSDDGGSNKTELIKKMERMMYVLFGCCFILAVIVFAANEMQWRESTLLYATAVAIAILPESLVVVITVAMTISVRRMAQERCIVRKLAALEVLGNVTDICSDKTGTLTENKMVVKIAAVGLEHSYAVTGAPMGIDGSFLDQGGDLKATMNSLSSPALHKARLRTDDAGPAYQDFFKAAALCSTTHLFLDPATPGMLKGTGNPTEIAIQVMTWKASRSRDVYLDASAADGGLEIAAEYAFDSSIKRMSVVLRSRTDPTKLYACTKGAPERVLTLCNWHVDAVSGQLVDLTADDRAAVQNRIVSLTKQGLRTICIARRNTDASPIDVSGASSTSPINTASDEAPSFEKLVPREALEKDLVFLGVVGIFDPPRPESGPSVHICQQAGITVRMLTGDHTSTAASIAETLGIINDVDDDQDKIVAGPDLDKMTNEEIDALVELPAVVGRCSPESKVKIIEALHRRGRIVAMTGDGFNDSPSIKIADIGCAMGSGTDVTKGVADIVITDDNFATIVKAVAEGRRIADAIRKFVIHLLSGNVAEVIVLMLGLPIRLQGASVFILSPIEILWLNMFTGSPPATGLSLDEADDTILLVPPNTNGFFTTELVLDTLFYGLFLGSVSLLSFVFVVFGYHGDFEANANDCNTRHGTNCHVAWTARATAFSVLYLGLMLHAYNVRSQRKSIFKIKWFDNPWLWGSVVFGVVTLVVILYVEPIATNVFLHKYLSWEWAVVAVAIVCFMALSEMYKAIKNVIDPLPIIHLPKHHHHKHRRGTAAGMGDASFTDSAQGTSTIRSPAAGALPPGGTPQGGSSNNLVRITVDEASSSSSSSEDETRSPPTSPSGGPPNVSPSMYRYTSDSRTTEEIARSNLTRSFAVSAQHTKAD